MQIRRGVSWTLVVALMLILTGVACKKKPPAPPPTPQPPPSPSAPTATLRAVPSTIEQGQATTLSWNSTNATELRIDPDVGSVGPQGSNTVSPERSTTYTLVAKGPGGAAEARDRKSVV